MADPIYLDFNATTPVDLEVANAMRPFIEGFHGNPSSGHAFGIAARRAVEGARAEVASLLGCDPDEVVFTSGGSESNNLALKGTALALRSRGRHLVTTAIEHPAVTEVCRFLEAEGFRVTYLPVDAAGLVDPAQVEEAIRPDTILVSVMHANNEVGTIEPIAAISRAAGSVRVHSDGAQAAGKVPARVRDLGVDLYSIAGHKLHAPKGVGALHVKRGTTLTSLIHGAGHEGGLRAGTENVAGIVGLGAACRVAARDLERNASHMREMRDRLHGLLSAALPGLVLNGHRDLRLPNTLSVSLPGLDAGAILSRLEGVAASAGAACHSGTVHASHVLAAMGVAPEVAMGTIRFSVGKTTTPAEVDLAAGRIVEAVRGFSQGAS